MSSGRLPLTVTTSNTVTTSTTNGNKSSRVIPSLRSESMAYPSSALTNFLSKAQYYARRHNQVLMVGLALFIFVVLLFSSTGPDSFAGGSVTVLRGSHDAHFGGAAHPGYFRPQDAVNKQGKFFHFAAVTDLDELSRVENAKKPTFRSILVPGRLVQLEKNRYKIEQGDAREVRTQHNEGGRGAEFSELTLYQNRLFTFDDRTGDVFEILNKPGGQESFVVPRFVITEGDGETDKGMKWEWATVKNGELVLGSMGKPYTRDDGSIKNYNNLYIAILNAHGELRRENWTKQFDMVKHALGIEGEGYIIMEAILWSDRLRKWIFLPRRISTDAYNDVKDERKGSNKLVLVDDKFRKATVVEIKLEDMNPLKGFSSFAFVPGTGDKHAIAIRSIEEDCAIDDGECKQQSFMVVFDVLTGDVLADEVEFNQKMKFEGIEFVDLHTSPPPPTTS